MALIHKQGATKLEKNLTLTVVGRRAVGMSKHSLSRGPRHKVAFKAIGREMEGWRTVVLSQRDTFLRIKGALYALIVRESGPSLCVYIGDGGNYVGRAIFFRARKS